MTRDEFIDEYLKEMDRGKYRTADGYQIGDIRRVALPCYCDYKGCKGWAMILVERVEEHTRFYGAPLEGAQA